MSLYGRYKQEVGPFKKFKNLKKVYESIAEELKSILGCSKTAQQCEARARTVLRRKKNAIDNNRTSGATRRPVPCEQELEEMRMADDSLQPQVIWNVDEVWRKAPTVISSTASPKVCGEQSEDVNEEQAEASSLSAPPPLPPPKATQQSRVPRPNTARMAEMAAFFEKMDEMSKQRDEREKQRERRHQELVRLSKVNGNLLRRLLGIEEVPLDE